LQRLGYYVLQSQPTKDTGGFEDLDWEFDWQKEVRMSTRRKPEFIQSDADIDQPIVSATLTIQRDDYYWLEYRIATGQYVTTACSYNPEFIRKSLEEELSQQPGIVLLPVIDRRKLKEPISWWQKGGAA
jgi:hypothetical protein